MIPLERFHFLHAWLVAESDERRRSMAKKKRKYRKLERSLPVMRANAGGIDIGATEIFVAVPADRDRESVRSFPTFTQDLHALADWLQQCRVDTVAMESTGVYWIPLFQSVASVFAFGWPVAGLVSSRTRRMRNSCSDAVSRQPRSDGLRACAAYAEVI